MKEKDKTKTTKPTKSKKKKTSVKAVTLWIISVFFVLGVLLVGFMGFILVQNYEIDESQLVMQETSILYDQDGNEATKLFFENREYIEIDKIPKQLQEAFVAIEDQRFYDHGGIDFKAIARALYRDIVARSLVEGGSTITQQLAKNVFLSHEKKLMRKTEEVLIAINLEKEYSKEKILEMYLNYIYFGHGAYGISSAAQVYFDKSVEDLELNEIALLAALPKGPGYYSPFIEGNEERSENRRKVVLNVMYEQGKISKEERDTAIETPLVLNESASHSENPALDTFVDMVLREAQEKYGLSQDDIYTGGYKIYTTLELKAQEAMYEAMRSDSELADELFPASGPDQIVQGSMVILNHSTGGITAAIGGRDYVRKGTNRATADARSPGSTFKPIASYAPALELGWHPYDTLVDEKLSFGGYSPRNYDNKYRGRVTMMDAIRQSYNIPAVWTLNEIGVDKGVESAKKFGIEKLNRELGIALGGSVQTSPLGMAKAFGTFGNHGVMVEPYLIERIVDRNDREVFKHDAEYKQVISAQSSWYMTKMLQRVVQDGTGTRGKLSHDVAAKTGTTQGVFRNGGVTDAWFVGYTPKYVAAVWMGYDRADENHVMQTSGGNHPARVFKYVMDKALEGQEPLRFERPQGVKELEPPVRLDAVQDLQAFLNLSWDMSVSVDIDFTPSEDGRIGYKVYRIDPVTNESQLLAEITKDHLVDGRRWSDTTISLNQPLPSYQLVTYNLETGQEGEPSNIATVQVNPGQFDRENEIEYDEDFADWLKDLLDRFNGGHGNEPGTEPDTDPDTEPGEEGYPPDVPDDPNGGSPPDGSGDGENPAGGNPDHNGTRPEEDEEDVPVDRDNG